MKIIFLNILETFEVRSRLISEKSFNLRLQLTSKFPSKPVDAGALPVSSLTEDEIHLDLFPTH